MLRITRRAGERVMLGDDVVIEVMEIRGQTVRLGIDAPRSLPIYREELWLEVKRENEAAARVDELPDIAIRLKPQWEAPAAHAPLARAVHAPPGRGAHARPGNSYYATSLNSCSSESSCPRSFFVIWPWIWQTRLSVTPRISPISRSVRL
jgi:carbon storage regulator